MAHADPPFTGGLAGAGMNAPQGRMVTGPHHLLRGPQTAWDELPGEGAEPAGVPTFDTTLRERPERIQPPSPLTPGWCVQSGGRQHHIGIRSERPQLPLNCATMAEAPVSVPSEGQSKAEAPETILELYRATEHLPRRHPDRWTYKRLAAKFGITELAVTKVIRGA
jgi:hypothetical protein